MPTPERMALTELQLSLLRVLWERGEATVTDVHGALRASERNLAPQTVATLLRRLERRGVVEHRTQGRQHVFRATVSEEQATREQLDEVTSRLFDGDASQLMTSLLKHGEIAAGDLARIRRMIEARERELGQG